MNSMPNFDQAKNYFQERLTNHGATPRGVDWNSELAQELRFSQLIKVIDASESFSLLDYGSGYGALSDYLLRLDYPLANYVGYDILETMTVQGRELHPASGSPIYQFTAQFDEVPAVDYGIVSGTFNIKLDASFESWTDYVVGELEKINHVCRKGFAFNLLTKYSDADHMRPHLYYADPCFMFDYCKRHFSRNVALLHDYEIYDFTILVRKTIA